MDSTTSTEFVEWMTFLDLEHNEVTKQDIYLAQIATEVVRPNVKDPKKLNVKDFIVKWDLSQKEEEMEEEEQDYGYNSDGTKRGTPEQEARKKKALENKQYWLGAIMSAKPVITPPTKQ